METKFKGNVIDVLGYEGLYKISDLGILYSINSNWRGYGIREMKYSINNFGYPRFHLTKNKKTKGITAHKIVTNSFLGERPNNKQVRHLDGNKLNFNLSNLIYGTAKENAEDRDLHFTTAKADKIGSSKLSKQDVIEIRNSYSKRGDMALLAKKFNVSCANIYLIIKNKSRKHG